MDHYIKFIYFLGSSTKIQLIIICLTGARFLTKSLSAVQRSLKFSDNIMKKLQQLYFFASKSTTKDYLLYLFQIR